MTREYVLILVLVEHTLRAAQDGGKCWILKVLILVLWNILSEPHHTGEEYVARRLNPCFSGTYSQSLALPYFCCVSESLNPCFSGTYSQRREEAIHY